MPGYVKQDKAKKHHDRGYSRSAAGRHHTSAAPRRSPYGEKAHQMTKGPLLKVLSANRVGARRDLAAAIKYGKIKVNGTVAENYLMPVDLSRDVVELKGKRIGLESSETVILMFNKPAGVVTTTSDEMGRETVIEMLPREYQSLGLYPVGRLDRDSTGLLLITNDGDTTYRLTHPKFEHEKEYLVAVSGRLEESDLDVFRHGVPLEDGVTSPAQIMEVRDQPPFNYRMIIHEGKKRQIRRMFETIGLRVNALKRIRVGAIELGNLPQGEVRELTHDEKNDLYMEKPRRSVFRREEQPARRFDRKPGRYDGERRVYGHNRKPGYRDEAKPERHPFNRGEFERDRRPFRESAYRDSSRTSRRREEMTDRRPFRQAETGQEERPFRKFPPRSGERPSRWSGPAPERRRFDRTESEQRERPLRTFSPRSDERPSHRTGATNERPFRKFPPRTGDRPLRTSRAPVKRQFSRDDSDQRPRPFNRFSSGEDNRPPRRFAERPERRSFKRTEGEPAGRPLRKFEPKAGERSFRSASSGQSRKPFRRNTSGEDRQLRR